MRIYDGLTQDTPRASLFRAGIGIELLERDQASAITEAVGRKLRGPRDLEFVHKYELAHTRGRLLQAAHDAAEDLRRDVQTIARGRNGAEVNRENLELAMMLTVGTKRGALVVDNPLTDSIEKRIKFAVNDYLHSAGAAR
jgi:hypothetical protein